MSTSMVETPILPEDNGSITYFAIEILPELTSLLNEESAFEIKNIEVKPTLYTDNIPILTGEFIDMIGTGLIVENVSTNYVYRARCFKTLLLNKKYE